MTIAFQQTAREVVTGAMRDMGIIRLNAKPRAPELEYGIEQLNLLLKSLASEGLYPWMNLEETATFGAAVSTVLLTPRPAEVSEARVAFARHTRLLQRLSDGEYDRYPNQAQIGVPVTYDLLETPAGMSMRVWPVPATETDIAYTYSRVIEDVDADSPLDVPQVWAAAIREMLKVRLTAFGPVDPAIEVRAEMMKRHLIDYERPEVYQFEREC